MKNHLLFAALAVIATCLTVPAPATEPPPLQAQSLVAPERSSEFGQPSAFETYTLVNYASETPSAVDLAAPATKPAPSILSAPSTTSRHRLLIDFLGLFFCMGMINQRTLRDKNLSVTAVLPAAGANSNTPILDTANVNPGRIDEVELIIELPATPNLADAHTITVTVQDSPDGVTFAANADLPPIVITGAGGIGAAAYAHQFKLPIGIGRYIRLNSAVAAAGGDSTALSVSLGLIF